VPIKLNFYVPASTELAFSLSYSADRAAGMPDPREDNGLPYLRWRARTHDGREALREMLPFVGGEALVNLQTVLREHVS